MRKAISLFILSLIYFTSSAQLYQEYLLSDWVFKSSNDKYWLPAEVPGSLVDDLLLNGKTTVKKSDTTWQYQTTFVVDKQVLSRDFVELNFQGLDTRATVYLNQKKILEANNMFRSWSIPIKSLAKEGENELLIQFSSDEYSPSLRKAFYHFDNPFIPVGVWKPVILESWNRYRLNDISFTINQIVDKEAHLTTSIDFRTEEELSLELEIYDEISGRTFESRQVTIDSNRRQVDIPFTIRKPKLWWPASLGKPNLYKLAVRTKLGENEQNMGKRIGIREVKIDTSSSKENLRLTINGKPVLVNKTAYQPFVLNVSSQRASDYDEIFTLVQSLGFTMVEVLGVGVYENEYFYDVADVRGILILQDFMFTPAVYPENEDFVKNVEEEVKENVQSLQHHPSIIAWGGVSTTAEEADVEVDATHINRILEKALQQSNPSFYFVAE